MSNDDQSPRVAGHIVQRCQEWVTMLQSTGSQRNRTPKFSQSSQQDSKANSHQSSPQLGFK